MKNKTKKMLAGIAMGVMGALSFTGCSGDISISQEELNKTIDGVNQHFVTIEEGIDKYFNNQNNIIAGEEAKSVFVNMMSEAYFNALNVKDITLKANVKQYDAFGIETYNDTMTYKQYYDTEKHVIKCLGSDNFYQEIIVNMNATDGKNYTIRYYNLEEKTYKEYIETRSFDSYISRYYIGLLRDFYETSIESEIIDDIYVVKNASGEYEVSYTIASTSRDNPLQILVGTSKSVNLTFKDGFVTNIHTDDITIEVDEMTGGYPAVSSYEVVDLAVEFNCEAFNVDTTQCVKK